MSEPRLSRRGLLAGGAATAVGALAACAPAGSPTTPSSRSSASAPAAPDVTASPAAFSAGKAVEPFHGKHQSGIETMPQAYAAFLGLDLRAGVDKEAIGRLMRLLTDDARRLTQGRPALADVEPELAVDPARLTVTFGFGPGLFKAAGVEHLKPKTVAPLPAFSIDRLEKRWNDGDLLVQICADDGVTLSHALRMIVKDARAFAKVRWTQRGFRRSPQVQAPGTTQRNLMGQLDGTVNPAPGTADFDRAVWISDGPEWLHGGTTLVLRRIHMDLETWDAADRVAREFSVGRRLDNGAPLTGSAEHDEPDFARLGPAGFPIISEYAHIRRARVQDPGMRIYRRPYNYDEAATSDGKSASGLLFASYQADIARQFVPIQQMLDEADLLNAWTVPIGSAVFAIPPGCAPNGWVGDGLLA
ncbi:Dyp-type peroxidase [Microtetraspora sp. NBRC 16547]|uniref:Dyp-type peroxidase n=1 Tax=Microtetraspora sp. NBRC 16547 TaxID=3030993 RepID=UPI0024A5B049|nr:Dyp-type peroxidase [Microtetraspora sp. NBRC 16547]GLW99264.1 peroxidase [Microtetraspora sp. NBRC 16547]